MSAFLPLYWIRGLGGSEATGGQLVSLLFGSGVLGGLAGGWLADRLGHRKIIILSFGLMAAAILLISQQKVPSVILICTGLVGICLYAPFSVMVVLGQEYVPNHVGLVSGIVFGLSTTVGGAFTPLLGVVCRSLWHTCHVHWNDSASLLGRVGPAAKSQK
jgi:MFS transporter, FSR family, fosmidomycin resistance protein